MLSKVKNSLVFRLARFYQLLLSLNKITRKRKAGTPLYNLVLLTGYSQLPLLRECLSSITRSFEEIPGLYIFVDKSLDKARLLKKIDLSNFENAQIITENECLCYHESKGRNSLKSFGEKNPMGLKMGAILQVLDKGKPVLYTDTDVLWFNNPNDIISKYMSKESFKMALSKDFQASYDGNLITRANLSNLVDAPYFCAGLLLIKELPSSSWAVMEDLLLIANEYSNHFTEQTIFSYLNRLNGNEILDEKGFIISVEDQYDFKPQRTGNLIARHYIGPVRHLFWRDAFFFNASRAGIKRMDF